MSSYFDALLRSAGSPLAASPSPLMAAAPAADAAELPEEEMTVETLDSPPAAPLASRLPIRAGDPRSSVSEPVAVEDAHASQGTAEPDQPAPPRHPEIVTPAALAEQGEIHPVVRAALRWVTADPVLIEREVPRSGTPPESTPAADRARSRGARTSPVGAKREVNRGPDRTDDGVTEQAAPAAAARQLPPADVDLDDLDLTWPIPPQPERTRAGVLDAPAAEQPEQIEIHIGTIHVAVDAPAAPRAIVQPAAPSPPPLKRPAPRSAFGRSRLPRL